MDEELSEVLIALELIEVGGDVLKLIPAFCEKNQKFPCF